MRTVAWRDAQKVLDLRLAGFLEQARSLDWKRLPTEWISPEPRMPKIAVRYATAAWTSVFEVILREGLKMNIAAGQLPSSLLPGKGSDFANPDLHEKHVPLEMLRGPIDTNKWVKGDHEQFDLVTTRALVRYDVGNRHDKVAADHLTTGLRSNESAEIRFVFDDFVGGALQLAAVQGVYVGLPLACAKLEVPIRGKNPANHDVVRDELAARARTAFKDDPDPLERIHELWVIAYKESRYQQFFESAATDSMAAIYARQHPGEDPKGLPRVGGGKDIGIMQIRSLVDGSLPKSKHCWNWKENVAAGVALYRAKVREVNQHYKNELAEHPEARAALEDKEFRRVFYKKAYYQRYNSSRFYWSWDARAKEWVQDPELMAKLENTWKRSHPHGPPWPGTYGDDAFRIDYGIWPHDLKPEDW